MAGKALETIRRFWDVQNSRDYTRLTELFTEDAVLEDPVYGTFRGRAAIGGFMTKMVEEMGKRGIHFDLVEVAGDEETAWAQWVARTPKGDRHGCGLYRVRDGRLSYYRDYMNG